MRQLATILLLSTGLTACQTQLPVKGADFSAVAEAQSDAVDLAPAGVGAKADPEITPSKIYGRWQLTYLNGLDAAFKAEEKLHVDKQETILWSTDLSNLALAVSYSLAQDNETTVTMFGCNDTATAYTGVIQTTLDDITRTDKFFPPTLMACFSEVRTASGEIKQTGRPAVDVAVEVMKSNQPNFADFRLEDDNQTLVFDDVLGSELARFTRWEAAE